MLSGEKILITGPASQVAFPVAQALARHHQVHGLARFGSDLVNLEEWCSHLGGLTGLPVRFRDSDNTIGSLPLDLSCMHAALGRTKVHWRDGLRRMVEARLPSLAGRTGTAE
jgi:nucleoside-diphosphate-sugar epimerase